jgi:hypothetical protein
MMDTKVKREKNSDLRSLIEEALNMHLYYEEKYYTLLMISYDDNKRMNQIIDDIQEKAEYWRDVHEELIQKIGY